MHFWKPVEKWVEQFFCQEILNLMTRILKPTHKAHHVHCTMEIQFYLAAVDICPYHFWDIIPPAGWLVLDRTQLFVNQSDKGPGTNCLILFPRTFPTLPTLTLMAAESPYFVCGELFYGSGIRKFPIQFLEKRKNLYFTFFPKSSSFLQT